MYFALYVAAVTQVPVRLHDDVVELLPCAVVRAVAQVGTLV